MEQEITVNSQSFLKMEEVISLRYNLLKYYYILLSQFLNKLTPSKLEEIRPDLKWKEFSKTPEFKLVKKGVQ